MGVTNAFSGVLSAVIVCHSSTPPRYGYCWNIDSSSVTQEFCGFVKAHSSEAFVKHDPYTYKYMSHEAHESADEMNVIKKQMKNNYKVMASWSQRILLLCLLI